VTVLVRAVIFGSVAVLVALAIWWSGADAHTNQAAFATTSVTASPRRAPRLEYQAPPPTLNLDDLDVWLAARFAKAEPTLLGIDCVAATCLFGVRYTAQALSHEELRNLLRDVRAEIERRVGFRMAVIHSDQDRDGRDYLWMYGLPADVDAEERELLRASAEARYSARMDPLRSTRSPPLEQR
jgi:hypothetical protein